MGLLIINLLEGKNLEPKDNNGILFNIFLYIIFFIRII